MTISRFSPIFAAIAVAFAVAGCEQRSDSPPAPSGSPSTESTPERSSDTSSTNPAGPPVTSSAEPDARTSDSANSSATAGNLAEKDRAFVTQVASSGKAEEEASRLTADKTTDPQVKSFAQDLAKDHSQVNQQLERIAEAKGISISSEPQAEARQRLDNLRGLSGDLLARTFVNDFGVEAHKKSIELYERQAREGTDPELKAFAEKTLPNLREHLAMAEDLANRVN